MADPHHTHDWAPFFHRLADAAGAAALPYFRTRLAVDNKEIDAFDPVTEADKAAEVAIRSLVSERFPDHGFLGEEFGDDSGGAEHVWVVDPIDGTRAFIAGLPVWGTLIGLKRADAPVFGMMAQPFIGERFFGDGRTAGYTGPHGSGPLRTRPCADLASATLFTTTPALFKGAEADAFGRVEGEVRLSRYGCDCYAYCMVAGGHVDLVIETGLKTFDIMALIPVIEGAGGVVTDWEGGSAIDGGRVVAAGDPRVHEQALKRLAGL
ncbi:histidinol-phosphatase [Chthonobacter rhizosphaerae]|uniref:histidinol-phosphatase n=1 Tax=Chthonobacter rhizosphaerae TaxID=2735553 RepID=UPI0015EF98D1|nr:histidinol-phosphatase [Chthonobacter rhizosphaerae]